MDFIQTMIEELALSGAVSEYPCSRSTLYRHARQINERLEREHYDWRVKTDIGNMIIEVV